MKCTGPHGQSVPCTLYDNFDGTRRIKITPSEIGHHIVEITYCGEHIHGMLSVAGPEKYIWWRRGWGRGGGEGAIICCEDHQCPV